MICPLFEKKVTKESNCRGCKKMSDTLGFSFEQLGEALDRFIKAVKESVYLKNRGGKI